MNKLLLGSLLFFGFNQIIAQADTPKFYLGASYGTSFSQGDFKDTDINNPDSGFADDGAKLDIYGGFFLNDRITLLGTFRYQTFNTEIGDVIARFNEDNPDVNFFGSTEDWRVYYLLLGVAYKVNLSKKFSFYPRIGIGPMVVQNPGISISAPDSNVTQSFNRSSETGFGLGFEAGIGFSTSLGRHFALMPAFTFGGGFANINDVVSTTDNISVTGDYQPTVLSFNLGLSVAYRFY
ncbi:outer membrane beta-barrel protein [Flagellimonas sp. S174]|uniref:outer membrane beta-barrel protein n=1 Tax=Flagellimonas sp. S174 TaxID=3410790 RepID=UPI003BF4E870